MRIGEVVEILRSRSAAPIEVEVDPHLLRASDVECLVADSSRFRRDTGWQPEIPLERTLEDLLEWWRAQV